MTLWWKRLVCAVRGHRWEKAKGGVPYEFRGARFVDRSMRRCQRCRTVTRVENYMGWLDE